MRLLVFLIFSFSLSVNAQTSNDIAINQSERITHFHSDIIVNKNSEMQVTESIEVIAKGNKIKRGIFRDFPTKYRDRYGNNYQVGFDIKTVLRNDYSEDYHTQGKSNGIRIYFGSQDRFVPQGKHKYLLRYTTNRQLGYFDEHDELYWNVTGNDWDFTIDKASANIQLPAGIPRNQIKLEAYTGYQGATDQNYNAYVDLNNQIYFETTRPLTSNQGLTIVVSFPKGFVNEPTTQEQMAYLFYDNRHLFYAVLGILFLLVYYVYSWFKVGKDPEKGVIIPLYHPPENYSPASMRYIENMSYDDTCFATGIINLAVKGFLTITETSSKDYKLTKTGEEVEMSPGESTIADRLFKTKDSITLKQSNHARIKSAINAHKATLKNDYEIKYFLNNTPYFVIGMLISILILAVVLFTGVSTIQNPEALFLIFWLTPWTLACFAMLKGIWNQFTAKNYTGLIGSIAFAAPFLFFEIVAIIFFVTMTSFSLLAILLTLCIINWLFYEWLKKPTIRGRKLLDKVEGFREYILLAEKYELDFKHPKGKCPELFEQYLPFALALDAEDSWARQFKDVISSANIDGQDYSPSWYHGKNWRTNNLSGFTSSLSNSFSSAISSSSTAPGSSSGSSGGGFSGGGGGGGGGGGW